MSTNYHTRTGLRDSVESIAYQVNQDYYKDLIDAFTELKNQFRADPSKTPDTSKISKITKHYTNKNVKLNIIDGKYDASCFIMPMTHNHPLNSEQAERILRIGSPVEVVNGIIKLGVVNLKNAKVDGVFANIAPTDINMGLSFFKTDLLTPAEIAAVYLHEDGHLFTYFYMMSKTYRTNFTLDVLARVYEDKNEEVKLALMDSIEGLTDVNFKDKQSATLSEAMLAINVGMVNEIRNDLGTKYIDGQVAEIVADQYATRFGAGTALIMALDKMGRDKFFYGKDHAYHSTFDNVLSLSLSTAFLMLPMKPLSSLSGIKSLATKAGFLNYLKTWFTTTDNLMVGIKYAFIGSGLKTAMDFILPSSSNMTVEQRYSAIKRDLIGVLKDINLPKDTIKSILADIDQIDNMIKDLNKVKSISKFIEDVMVNNLTPNARGQKFHLELEQLANNDLFKHAANLKLKG